MSYPAFRSSTQVWLPMYPAPPETRIAIEYTPSSRCLVSFCWESVVCRGPRLYLEDTSFWSGAQGPPILSLCIFVARFIPCPILIRCVSACCTWNIRAFLQSSALFPGEKTQGGGSSEHLARPQNRGGELRVRGAAGVVLGLQGKTAVLLVL